MTKKATADPTPDPKPEPKPTTEPTLLKLIKEVTELTEPTDEQVVEPEDVAAALSLSMNLLDDDDATLDDPYSMSMGPDYLDDDPAPAATAKSSKSKASKSKSGKETECATERGEALWSVIAALSIHATNALLIESPPFVNLVLIILPTFVRRILRFVDVSAKKQPFMPNSILVSESLSQLKRPECPDSR